MFIEEDLTSHRRGKSMMLYPGEVAICSEHLFAAYPTHPMPGTLYLTSARLVFWAAQGPSYDPIQGYLPGGAMSGAPSLDLNLHYVTNAAAYAGGGGWHTLRVEANGGQYVYQFQTPRAQEWAHAILTARSRMPLAGATSAAPPVAPVTLGGGVAPAPAESPMSPAPPVPVASPAGIAAGTVYCARCGQANGMGSARCARCGSSL